MFSQLSWQGVSITILESRLAGTACLREVLPDFLGCRSPITMGSIISGCVYWLDQEQGSGFHFFGSELYAISIGQLPE